MNNVIDFAAIEISDLVEDAVEGGELPSQVMAASTTACGCACSSCSSTCS